MATHPEPTRWKGDHGAVPTELRTTINTLVAVDKIPETRIEAAYNHIAQSLGFDVEGEISRRTIGRIGKEGGIAAKLQFVDAVQQQGASA